MMIIMIMIMMRVIMIQQNRSSGPGPFPLPLSYAVAKPGAPEGVVRSGRDRGTSLEEHPPARRPRDSEGGPPSRFNQRVSKERGSQVTTGLVVLCSQFSTCSNSHADRCLNPPPCDPLSSS